MGLLHVVLIIAGYVSIMLGVTFGIAETVSRLLFGKSLLFRREETR